jgi:hypothetical protein
MGSRAYTAPTDARAGGLALSLIASPLTEPMLRACTAGPVSWPSSDPEGSPQFFQISKPGREALAVSGVVERWLRQAPAGPIAIASHPAEEAIMAFLDGWESTLFWALADGPVSLAELAGAVEGLGRMEIKQRVRKLRGARMVRGGHGALEITEWARLGMAPLLAAVHCERRRMSDRTPVTQIELETALRLAMPLVRIDAAHTGSCLLAVEPATSKRRKVPGPAGVRVEIEDGAVVSSAAAELEDPPAWAAGTIDAWLQAVRHGRLDRLRFGGQEPNRASALVEGMHSALGEADGSVAL